MPNLDERLAAVGVKVPEIFLPSAGTDWTKWAVVACDQYSSEKEYWEDVKTQVGASPSTLNLIFPECYLEDPDKDERILNIQSTMNEYLRKGVLDSAGRGFVLVERSTPFVRKPRKGLVVAVDLEKYEFGRNVATLIRPSELTIVERLPPRLRIRRGAALEIPHIMLLVDDPGRTVIEPLYAARDSLPGLYDFELMEGAGRVRGWHVREESALTAVSGALSALADPSEYARRYGRADVLLFAVGDGNHSLATAKASWEEIKKAHPGDPALENHPARWALAEMVNIYDEGLPFHPIHRVLFKVNEAVFLEELSRHGECQVESLGLSAALAGVDAPSREHRFALLSRGGARLVRFSRPAAHLAVGTIQDFLDAYLSRHPETGLDFIHGTESLESLSAKEGNLGIYLPPFDKSGFFASVIRDGVMPRKAFSMGEAPEKRFYVEARKILP